MKKIIAAGGLLALLLAISSDALVHAQRPGPPRGGRGLGVLGGGARGGADLLTLSSLKPVQQELEMLDDQAAEVAKLREELQPQRRRRGRGRAEDGDRDRGGRRNFQDLSREERQERFEELRKRREEQTKQAETKLNEILLPHQVERLKQIQLQTRGIAALNDPEVAAKLEITEQQREEMQNVAREAGQAVRGEIRELAQEGDREALRDKMQELAQQTEAKVLAVLNDSQREQFAEMKGEPFEMPEELRRGRGRGGRPGAFRRGRGERGQDSPQRRQRSRR